MVYLNRSKTLKRPLFTENEKKFLKNRDFVNAKQRYNLNKEIKRKIHSLKEGILSLGELEKITTIDFLSDTEKWQMIEILMENLDVEVIDKWRLDQYKQDEEAHKILKNITPFLKKIKNKKYKIRRITSTKLSSEEYIKIISKSGTYKEKLRRLFKSKDFILKKKIEDDEKFMNKCKLKEKKSKEIKPLKEKKFFKIKQLKERINIARIEEFYERGIILSRNVNRKDFLKACIEITETKNKINVEINYFPFKYKENNEKEVKLNPYYQNINFICSL